MESDGSAKVMYEARRQARGSEPAARARPWRRRLAVGGAGVVLAAAAAVGFHLWWASGHVRAIHATVRAALVAVSPHTDARVKALFVRPGDSVTAGQELLRLDDSEAQAALAAAQAVAATAASRLTQAEAIAKGTEARLNAELLLAKAGVEIARARVANAQALLDTRKARLPEEVRRATAERDEAKARLELLRRGPRKEDIDAAKVKLATARSLAELYAQELKQAEELAAQGLEAMTQAFTKRAQLTAQEGLVREDELALARLEAGSAPEEVRAAEHMLAAREAALRLASAGDQEIASLTADLRMREAEVHQAEAQVARAEAALAEIAVAKEQVTAAAADLHRAQAEVEGRRATLAAMSIASPVTGTVFLTLHRPGEVCKKGDATVYVADERAGRWVEAHVREQDAEYVKVGQKATVGLVTGEYVEATVDAVGLSTSSLGRPAGSGGADPAGRAPAELVWVRFKFVGDVGRPLHGSSASALIHVR